MNEILLFQIGHPLSNIESNLEASVLLERVSFVFDIEQVLREGAITGPKREQLLILVDKVTDAKLVKSSDVFMVYTSENIFVVFQECVKIRIPLES